ncbi:YunG family protein [Rhizobium panacihumi]|uniref:YunG family protein n=1 Tax=Rhizobium panacihumi TaxID=2008450 RepID=UPI003D7BD745
MLHLREALEASWGNDTSFMAAEQAGNPALGQCYPTCRVVQHFYPETEIIKGTVRTSDERDAIHFWNALPAGNHWYHIDLSWQQFAPGANVIDFTVLDRHNLNDGEATVRRVSILLERVRTHLAGRSRISQN